MKESSAEHNDVSESDSLSGAADKRKSGRSRKAAAVFAAGIAYWIWLKGTGLGVPCVFRLATGWKCPGCGISTMLLRLAERDPAGAFAANPFLFLTWPVILFELLFAAYPGRASGKMPVWNNVLLIVYLAALLLFGILRNIPIPVFRLL